MNDRKSHGKNQPPRRKILPRLPPDLPANYLAYDDEDDTDIDNVKNAHTSAKRDRVQAELIPWQPPAHLPVALLPGGLAEKVLKAGAQAQGIDRDLLGDLEKGLDRIRRHPSLNSPPATDSPKIMKKVYKALLHKKIADRVLRLSLGVHAGLEMRTPMRQQAIEDFKNNFDGYEALLGELLPLRWRITRENERYNENSNLSASADWGAFLRCLKAGQGQAAQGLLTGFRAFDEITGGFRGVTLLAGLTGAGKTTLGLNFATGVLRQDKKAGVVVFNLEMDRDKYYPKLLSLESRVDYRTLRAGGWSKGVEEAVKAAQDRLMADILPRLRVVDAIEDTKDGQQTLFIMEKTVLDFMEGSGVERVLIIVDRLQKLEVEMPVVSWLEDNTPQYGRLTDLEADDARMELLLELQKESQSVVPGGFPVLGLSRVNKVDPGRRLTLADVPGKAELVFEADSVLLLEPAPHASASKDVTPTLLNVAKVRDGGWKGDFQLDFHHTVSLFKERGLGAKDNTPPSVDRPAGPQPGHKAKRFTGK